MRRAGSRSCRRSTRPRCRRKRWSSSSSFPGVAHARRARPGRGAAAHRRPRRADHRAADAAVHAELPEEHEHRVAAVALGVRSREGVHRRLPDRAEGRLPARGQQALARDPAVGDRAPRALPRPRRQVPAVPLQPLDPRAVARVPRALRVRADARLAARAARVRRRRVREARRVVRAGIPEDAAADAARLRQLHAGPGRVGGEAARGLDADARADAAAVGRRAVLRRPHRHRRPAPPRSGAGRRPRDVPRRRRRSMRASSSACAGCPSRTPKCRSPASCRCASSGCC